MQGMAAALVIGIGNDFRGDDGLGLEIVRRLRADGAVVKEVAGDAFSLMEAWRGAARVILVDAVRTGQEPGRVHRIEAGDRALPGIFASSSTHGFGLGQALELARKLDELPERVTIVGVEGREYEMGRGLSPEAAAGCEEAVALIQALLRGEISETVSDSKNENDR